MDDIDFNGTSENQWTPIINFAGTFEGNNHSIKKLYINSSKSNVGFFGNLIGNGKINGIKLEDVNITGSNNTGGIVGNLQSTNGITNCIISGTITGANFTGGIVGITNDNTSKIENCKVYANVTGTQFVGGVAGTCKRPIMYCGMYGNTKATTNFECLTGGIAGELTNNYIYGCVNKGNITAQDYIGGIVGDLREGAYVSYCYSTGNLTSQYNTRGHAMTGGIVGESYGNVDHCFASGTISGQGDYVGGVIGRAVIPITGDCLTGIADVYRKGVFVGTSAWNKNNSGGLYGSNTNISCTNHYYVQGEHTLEASLHWFLKEFVENGETPGIPKLNWED